MPTESELPSASETPAEVSLIDTIMPLIKINVDAIAFSIAEALEQWFAQHHSKMLLRENNHIIIRKDAVIEPHDYQAIVEKAINDQLCCIHAHFHAADPAFCLNLAVNVVAIVQDQDPDQVRTDVGNRLTVLPIPSLVEPHPNSSASV